MQTIDEVLAALDEILAECRQKNSSLGLFAFLYRRVTAQIKEGIAQGIFADHARMGATDALRPGYGPALCVVRSCRGKRIGAFRAQ